MYIRGITNETLQVQKQLASLAMSIEQTQNKHPKLHKFLADSGLCSRRQGEILISSGSVTVNGQKPKLGERIDPFKDVIKLNGKEFSQKSYTNDIYG